MKELRVFEAFAGIGAQHKALSNLKKKKQIERFEIVAISEWDMWANIAYDAIHNKNNKVKLCSNKEEFMSNHDISKDSKTPITHRAKILMNDMDFNNLYKSYIRSNNIGSIVNMYDRYIQNSLDDRVDVLTYSFPCQDLSNAGNFHGFNKGIKEGTRSGLLLEVEKLLVNLKSNNKKLPKVLLLENVANLLSHSHIESFNRWNEYLSSLGYSTTFDIINSKDYKCAQSRKRVFSISILDNRGIIKRNLKEKLDLIYNEYKPKNQYNSINEIIDFDNKNFTEEYYDLFQVKNTPSRHKYSRIVTKEMNKEFISTVTTKQDRNPNTGLVPRNIGKRKIKGFEYLNNRFLSTTEVYLLMGFDKEDAFRVEQKYNEMKKSSSFIKEKMYRQAGNSISVQVLELIFKFIVEETNE